MPKIIVRPLGWPERTLDSVANAATRIVTGYAQRTHAWNNDTYPPGTLTIDESLCVLVEGIPGTGPRWLWGIPLFHMPGLADMIAAIGHRLGKVENPDVYAWRSYSVIAPACPNRGWHTLWKAGDATGVSRITLTTPARLLTGPGDCVHGGIDGATNSQIRVCKVGEGRLGTPGEFDHLPLL